MPQRTALDKDNNLYVFYKHLLSKIGKLTKILNWKQTLLNPNSGPPKINPNNLYITIFTFILNY